MRRDALVSAVFLRCHKCQLKKREPAGKRVAPLSATATTRQEPPAAVARCMAPAGAQAGLLFSSRGRPKKREELFGLFPFAVIRNRPKRHDHISLSVLDNSPLFYYNYHRKGNTGKRFSQSEILYYYIEPVTWQSGGFCFLLSALSYI